MPLAFKKGDTFSTSIDFDGVAFAGYAITANLTSNVTGEVVTAFTTSVTDAAAAQVTISLSAEQTAALAVGTYGWRLDWVAPGNVHRAALWGVLEVVA
jgi:hypothetical protein